MAHASIDVSQTLKAEECLNTLGTAPRHYGFRNVNALLLWTDTLLREVSFHLYSVPGTPEALVCVLLTWHREILQRNVKEQHSWLWTYLTSPCLHCNTYGTNSAVILFIFLFFFFFSSEIKNHHNQGRLENGLYNNFSVGHTTKIKASGHSFSNSAPEDWVSSFQCTEKEAQVMLYFLCVEIIKWRIKPSISSAANCKTAVFPRNWSKCKIICFWG